MAAKACAPSLAALLSLLIAVILGVANAQVSAVRSWEDILLVDDFATPQYVSASGYHFTWTAVSGEGILGTDRMLDVVAMDSGRTATCEVTDGVLVVSSPDTGFNVGVDWQGESREGLHADLSEGIGMRVRVKSAEFFITLLEICSGNGGPECAEQSIRVESSEEYQDIFFAFTKYSSVEFANVNEIRLEITSTLPHEEDIFMESVSVVAGIAAIPGFIGVVDDFTTALPRAELEISSDPTLQSPAVMSRNSDDSSILGGERNQAIVVIDPGYAGHTGTVGMEVSDMGFSASMSFFGGYVLLQYDGEDGVTSLDGPNLSVGLGGFDGTANGQAGALRISVGGQDFLYNPYVASLTVWIYDTNDNVGVVRDVGIAPLGEVLDFWFPLSTFGMVDVTSIAAIEVMLSLNGSTGNIYVTAISFVGAGSGTQGCAAAVPVGDGHLVLSNADGMVYSNLCGLGTQSGLVWLSYVAGDTGALYISTCDENTTIDTIIAVVSDCESLGCIAVNDDAPCHFPGGERTSSTSVNVNKDQQYYIAVGGYGTAEGPIGLTMELMLAIGVIIY